MLPLALFVVILALTFGAMLLVMRPTRSEKVVQERLSKIERMYEGSTEDASILLRREKLSDVAWLNEFLNRIPGSLRLQRFLSQAGSSWTVGQLLFLSLFLTGGGSLLAAFWAPTGVFALLLGLAAGSVPYLYLSWKRSSRFNRFEELLQEAIDLMARALRAGHGIVPAIEMVSQEIPDPVGAEFRRIFEEQNFGLPLREALLNLATRVPLPDVQFLITAILVQKETGGNLAEVLDKTTAVIRERYRLRGQLRIYTAQGRITGWILGLMPFGIFIAMGIINPSYGQILLQDPLGQKLIYLGLGLMAVGVWVIRKVIDIKV